MGVSVYCSITNARTVAPNDITSAALLEVLGSRIFWPNVCAVGLTGDVSSSVMSIDHYLQ